MTPETQKSTPKTKAKTISLDLPPEIASAARAAADASPFSITEVKHMIRVAYLAHLKSAPPVGKIVADAMAAAQKKLEEIG